MSTIADVLTRVAPHWRADEDYRRASASYDGELRQAHAVHPNHPEKYDEATGCAQRRMCEGGGQQHTARCIQPAVRGLRRRVPRAALRRAIGGGSTLATSNIQASMHAMTCCRSLLCIRRSRPWASDVLNVIRVIASEPFFAAYPHLRGGRADDRVGCTLVGPRSFFARYRFLLTFPSAEPALKVSPSCR